MTNNANSPRAQSRQSGAALITGLIFLVVLTMIGITAARMSTLEERMSGNMRDRSVAMQAAELALRDAERDVRGQGTAVRTTPISGITYFAANCNQDNTGDSFDDGLCYNGPAGYGVAIWTTVNMTAAPSVAYGRFTGATPIAGLSAQPRYVIEGIRRTPPGGGEVFYYRITVRAQGANLNTVIWLQEVFTP
jgi:type IV pilus assembly protein PilX